MTLGGQDLAEAPSAAATSLAWLVFSVMINVAAQRRYPIPAAPDYGLQTADKADVARPPATVENPAALRVCRINKLGDHGNLSLTSYTNNIS
jgi:hypothetical protein